MRAQIMVLSFFAFLPFAFASENGGIPYDLSPLEGLLLTGSDRRLNEAVIDRLVVRQVQTTEQRDLNLLAGDRMVKWQSPGVPTDVDLREHGRIEFYLAQSSRSAATALFLTFRHANTVAIHLRNLLSKGFDLRLRHKSGRSLNGVLGRDFDFTISDPNHYQTIDLLYLPEERAQVTRYYEDIAQDHVAHPNKCGRLWMVYGINLSPSE